MQKNIKYTELNPLEEFMLDKFFKLSLDEWNYILNLIIGKKLDDMSVDELKLLVSEIKEKVKEDCRKTRKL